MNSKLIRALVLGVGVGILTPAVAWAGSSKAPAAAHKGGKKHKHHKSDGKDGKDKK